jgi:hypothetical protein
MLRRIDARRSDGRATLWLLDTTYLWAVPLWSLGGLPLLKVVPWWGFIAAIVAGSVFVTRIRFVRGDQAFARVTVLWLGLVPVKWRRQGCEVIIDESSIDNESDISDEVTLNARGGEPWSFHASKAEAIAAWLCQARSDVLEVPVGRDMNAP